MKTTLPSASPLHFIIFLLVFAWDTSFGQNDVVINTTNELSGDENSIVDDVNTGYLLVNTDKKLPSEYKNLQMKVLPLDESGTISVMINSNRNRTILIEVKNNSDDELLFQSVNLKKGNNIISFDNDNSKVLFLKVGKMDSNNNASFVVLRK